MAHVARVARQASPVTGDDVNRPPAFATALSAAVFGESKTSTLLNDADADYLLAVKDAGDVPSKTAQIWRCCCVMDICLRIRMPV